MTWNLTKPPSPEEIAALTGEVIHQRRVGTKLAEGASVCDQTGVQCSTSATGEGVSCPLCLVVVRQWAAEREAKETRVKVVREQKRAARERSRLKALALNRTDLRVDVDPERATLIDEIVEEFYPSRRQAFLAAVDLLIAERAPELRRRQLARQTAARTAALALQFAGRTEEGSVPPTRHTTALKQRLLRLERDLAEGAED